MKKYFKGFLIGVVVAGCLTATVSYAQIGSINFFKKVGDVVQLINENWTFYAKNAEFDDVSIGGVSAGDLDMNGNDITNVGELDIRKEITGSQQSALSVNGESTGLTAGSFDLIATSDWDGNSADESGSYVGLFGSTGIDRGTGNSTVALLTDASQVGGGEQLDYTVLAVNDRIRIQPFSVSGEGQNVYLSGGAFGGGGSVNGFVAIDDATSPTTPTQTLDEESLFVKNDLSINGTGYFNTDAIGETQGNALSLVNSTPATVDTDQYSPSLRYYGNAWNTTSSTSQSTYIDTYNQTGKSSVGFPTYMVDSVDGDGTRTNLLGMSKFGTAFNIVAYFNANQVMSDNRTIFFGNNANDSGMEWDTNQTNDTLAMWLGSSSKSLLVADFANKNHNYALPASDYPAFYFMGNTTSSDTYGKVGFDDTDFIIETGAGGNVFNQTGTELEDDAYYDLKAGASGWGTVMIGDNQEYANFNWSSDGTVDLNFNSSNVVNTDTDGKLCIFDNGTNVRIKNRLGSTLTIKYQINY